VTWCWTRERQNHSQANLRTLLRYLSHTVRMPSDADSVADSVAAGADSAATLGPVTPILSPPGAAPPTAVARRQNPFLKRTRINLWRPPPLPWQTVVPLPSRDNHVSFLRIAGGAPEFELKITAAEGDGCRSCAAVRAAAARKAARLDGGPRITWETVPFVAKPPPRRRGGTDCGDAGGGVTLSGAEEAAAVDTGFAAAAAAVEEGVSEVAAAAVDGDTESAAEPTPHHVAVASIPALRGDFSHTSRPPGRTIPLSASALRAALAEARTRTPLPHQADIVARAALRAPIVTHLKWCMGLGKTEGAGRLTAGDALPHRPLLVWVTHNSLVAAAALVLSTAIQQAPGTWTEVHVVGFTEFTRICARAPRWLEGATAVVDEAHNFRNVTPSMVWDLEALARADFVVLLTGTPLQNDRDDLRGYLALTRLWTPAQAANAARPLPSPNALRTALASAAAAGRFSISCCDPRNDPALARCFPVLEDALVKVPMTWMDALLYVLKSAKSVTFGHLVIMGAKANSFDMLTRLMCNTSAKVDAMVADIPRLPKPQTIYSNFRERGSNMVMTALAERLPSLRQAAITGSTPTGERQGIQERFRRGLIDVLQVSEAAKEGIDLPNAKACQIMEEQLNEASKQQLRYRVQRFVGVADSADGTVGPPPAKRARKLAPVSDASDFGESGVASAASDPATSPAVQRRTVKIVQYISTFPDHPPTAAEADALRAHFRDTVLGARNAASCCPDDFDVVPLLQGHISALGGTKDEQLMMNNARKHAEIQPYLDVLDVLALQLQRCAVTHVTCRATSPKIRALNAPASAGIKVGEKRRRRDV